LAYNLVTFAFLEMLFKFDNIFNKDIAKLSETQPVGPLILVIAIEVLVLGDRVSTRVLVVVLTIPVVLQVLVPVLDSGILVLPRGLVESSLVNSLQVYKLDNVINNAHATIKVPGSIGGDLRHPPPVLAIGI
jgi:hypothetical protein